MVFSKFRSRLGANDASLHVRDADVEASDSERSIIRDGELAYTLAKGGNGSRPAYQEAVGAPVERHSPLGYHVGWITVIFLNVNQMIGTGIFSTRMENPRFLSGLLTLTESSHSCVRPQGHRLRRFGLHLLGHRFHDGPCRP